METAFFQVIKKGQESGEIKNTQDALVLAKFIFNAVKGMQVSAKSNADATSFGNIIKLTVAVLG